jgi:hypothetical protein
MSLRDRRVCLGGWTPPFWASPKPSNIAAERAQTGGSTRGLGVPLYAFSFAFRAAKHYFICRVTKKWANPTKVRKLCSHPQKAFEKIFRPFFSFFQKTIDTAHILW